MERANIIQARHDEETTSLAKRQVGPWAASLFIRIVGCGC